MVGQLQDSFTIYLHDVESRHTCF